MQSLTQAHSGSGPETTEQPLDTEPSPAHSQPHSQEEERKSAAPVKRKAGMTKEKSQTAEIPAGATAVQNHPVRQTPKDKTTKPDGPTQPVPGRKPSCDEAKAKKQVKSDGRKYVPSKKAMIDPLKMDMSKPLVMPLTSSQLSLQCIECHIIFSDHKSKERHLKLSHPTQYEECILRNALFACYVCDRHFTNSTELMVHQKAHTEKTPFKCPICHESFKKSSELTAHKKVHFAQGGYACTDCGKPCKTMTLLKYHQRTHTGERPYICKECGKRFTMSKALQKHITLHLLEGAEGGGDTTAKGQPKKNNDASTVKYPCPLCKATFKSSKTRVRHMKSKHNMVPVVKNSTNPAGQQGKQSTPIITPISICQPALLQVEPNGPLQKVDANIDTEQIRKLIESMGNVQKVNQVVILGQVPPHAPPLEVQQVSQVTEPANLYLGPPQIDFIGLKPTESSDNSCNLMEQTIILEPITPEGQLENHSFSEFDSHIAACETIELTLVPADQIENPDGQILPQPDINTIHTDPTDPIVCQNESDDLNQNLQQTVIIELTPALTPTAELEQLQTAPQDVIPSSSLVPTDELVTPDQTVDKTLPDEQSTSMPVPPLLPTVELELTSVQTEQQDLSACSVLPAGTDTQAPNESETNPKEEIDLHMQKESANQNHHLVRGDALQENQEKAEEEQSNELVENHKNEMSKTDVFFAKEQVSSQPQTEETPQTSELPINVMSAQELVKVRKRKPARAVVFQGYMQDLVGSIYKDDLYFDAKPAKRQRTKKSHLVVKFSPQSKEKKNMKQKKLSQECEPVHENVTRTKTPKANLSERKVSPQKKGRKGKMKKVEGNKFTTAKTKSPSSTQVEQNKEGKGKMKKPKQVAQGYVPPKAVASPMFKKKKQAKNNQNDQPKNTKVEKVTKNLVKGEEVKKAEAPGLHSTQDSLLLLKGHKQPQLKVYKLDPSKASGQTAEVLPQEPQTKSQSNVNKLKHSITEPTPENKKKAGRPNKNKKALSLLSSLQASRQPPETSATKPKTTRKRKASSKVETEGIITSSHSKRALECKDCGERFSEVSSLQKHKTTVHIVESPSLTYTNGNIFEGVSTSDLYQLAKDHKVVGGMNAATDWDTEPETVEMTAEDREQNVSFPALIPSPSLPVPLADVENSSHEIKSGSKLGTEDQSYASTEVHSSSVHMKNRTLLNSTSEFLSSTSTQTKPSEKGEVLPSDEEKPEESTTKNITSKSEVHDTMDDDIKEDLVLEVDLVTVGEQNEKDDLANRDDSDTQNEPNESCSSEFPLHVNNEATEKSLTLQTVSCSTHSRDQVEIKEEEEEILVQKKKDSGKGGTVGNATKSKRKGTGRHKKGAKLSSVSGGDTVKDTESEKGQDECQVVYEKHPISSDPEMSDVSTSQPGTSPDCETSKATVLVASLPASPSALEDSHDKQVELDLPSGTVSVHKVMNVAELQEGQRPDRESDQSPGIILEKIVDPVESIAACKNLMASTHQRKDFAGIAQNGVQNADSQEIKAENGSDPLHVAPIRQNKPSATGQPHPHRDIRTILVKEESSLMPDDPQATQSSKHICWNVEPVNHENIPLMETEETTRECRISPEINTNQCIFYPVKEEEREVLLGAPRTSRGSLTPETFSDPNQIEHPMAPFDTYAGRNATPDIQEARVADLLTRHGGSDFSSSQDLELQHPPDLRDFLLQSSDEDDVGGFELSDPQRDSEAEVMAYFSRNQTKNAQSQSTQNLPAASSQLQATQGENQIKNPIDYFCRYFGLDTWMELANCTNKVSNMPNPVTPREVACFVGIHIAMGTLKFPSPKLYWEDLTKVPLIAEATPLSRFLELARMLKLTSPSKDPANSNTQEAAQECDNHNVQQGATSPCRHSVTSERTCDSIGSQTQTDPLWKVRPLLRRFQAGCNSPRREGDYAVDQYPLPLTGKVHRNKLSLHCTTLIGFGGLLLDVDIKLDLSDKEDIVESMVSKGSMVFLCKQELSTPAMLERLLAAGVHGAGRVGGARGQIGDEFISSDGKLMLRRSHCGFILSTAGHGQRNMASLIDNFEKAQMSARLSRDLLSLYNTPLTASAPTCWPQAVLWYLVDLALVNSWLLHRQDHRAASVPLTLMAFRLEVSKALILSSGCDTQDSIPPQPPEETACGAKETPNPFVVEESPLPDAATRYDGAGHWPEQLSEGEGGKCRFGNCQRTSRVLCLKCCVFLCISRNHNCFLNFHNQESSGKE